MGCREVTLSRLTDMISTNHTIPLVSPRSVIFGVAGGVDPIIRGMIMQNLKLPDGKLSDAVTERLFQLVAQVWSSNISTNYFIIFIR